MTTKEVEIHGGSDLTITADQRGFTEGQVAALQQIGVQDATAGDLAVFFHQAQARGLDPFTRQIYMIGRRSKDARTGEWVTKQTIQTGIDGFRLIARRAADARGEALSIDDTLWADPNGGWHDVWIWPEPPQAAKTTVRIGAGSFSGVATLHDYCPTDKNGNPTGQWRRMPAVMLAKCSEALALRKAFPEDLSGIYTGDEMGQADARTTTVQQQAAPASSPTTPPSGPSVQDAVNAVIEACQGDMEAAQAAIREAGIDPHSIRPEHVAAILTVAQAIKDTPAEQQDALPDDGPAFPEGGNAPTAA